MLEQHEIIRVTHIVACFTLWSRSARAGLKLMKNDHFLVFLAAWLLFHRFLGRLRSALY